MSTTLQAESFADINLAGQPRSTLASDVAKDATSVLLASTDEFEAGDIIYVGALAREQCEKAIVESVDDATTLTLTSGLQYAHKRFDAVTAVLGDKLRIYRALNADGTPPADTSFNAYAARNISPEQVATYYTDSSGSSDYWYKLTYWNETSGDETDPADSEPVRGDDYGHYASIIDIRKKAGFENAVNLKDYDIDLHRRNAETYLNGKLAANYTVPFKPVPDAVNALTIQLSAAMLKYSAYGVRYQKELDDARAAVDAYADNGATIVDDDGNSLSSGGMVSSYPDEDAPRSFTIGQVF